MSAPPTIGVTVSRRSGWRIFPLIAFNVWLAGGRALRWQAPVEPDTEKVHGIIIGGGDDIAPALYGAQPRLVARLDPARDALEQRIVSEAWKRNIPLLGICRGSQMLNVALGGTLDQDAYTTFGTRNVKTILPRKTVTIEEDTRLADLAGPEPMRVNALHSQAVEKLGPGLRIAARGPRGMPQAIERERDPFMLGVQWHPEHLFYARRHRALFRALVAAASAHRDKTSQQKAVDGVA
ncbi:MAG: gamma-glutamyl-gamma-aminobutyrate hydrolase family protein [Pseudomonadota bacterium]